MRVVQTAARLADRYYVWMILLHRYPNGIRGVAGFAYGISQLPWSTFLALNFVAAGLWSCATVSVGYAFGQVSEKMMNDASSGLGLVMLVLFLGALMDAEQEVRARGRAGHLKRSWKANSAVPREIALDQPQPLQTGMPVLADDDVVVHGDAERAGNVDDGLRHLDIRLRRRRVAGGMVVHQDHRGGG